MIFAKLWCYGLSGEFIPDLRLHNWPVSRSPMSLSAPGSVHSWHHHTGQWRWNFLLCLLIHPLPKESGQTKKFIPLFGSCRKLTILQIKTVSWSIHRRRNLSKQGNVLIFIGGSCSNIVWLSQFVQIQLINQLIIFVYLINICLIKKINYYLFD